MTDRLMKFNEGIVKNKRFFLAMYSEEIKEDNLKRLAKII